MKKILVFILLTGLSVPVFLQISPYLDFGNSGLKISAGGEQTNGLKGCFGEIGGSIKGIVALVATVNAIQALSTHHSSLITHHYYVARITDQSPARSILHAVPGRGSAIFWAGTVGV